MRKLAIVTSVALVLVGSGCFTAERTSTTGALRAAPQPAIAPAAEPRAGIASSGSSRASRGTAQIGDFVRAREQQLQFCYSEARVEQPDLSGSATVSITLAEDGAVQDARIVRSAWSGKKNAARGVESCMLARVRAWRFPAGDPRDPNVHSFAVIFSR